MNSDYSLPDEKKLQLSAKRLEEAARARQEICQRFPRIDMFRKVDPDPAANQSRKSQAKEQQMRRRTGTVSLPFGVYTGEYTLYAVSESARPMPTPDGEGHCAYTDGSSYNGAWKMNRRHGSGLLELKNGSSYEGEWAYDRFHGQGAFRWDDGTWYYGAWLDDKAHGFGQGTLSDGSKYVGEWADGQRHGNGEYHLPGGQRYDGRFERGLVPAGSRGTWTDKVNGEFTVVLRRTIPPWDLQDSEDVFSSREKIKV